MATTTTNETRRFSEFPEKMDEYFINNPVTILVLPDEFIRALEWRAKDHTFTSAKDFIKFIDAEIEFWEQNDEGGVLKDFTKIDSLKSAKQQFESAKRSFEASPNVNSLKDNLNRCVSSLSHGTLYSKTGLAKYLLNLKGEKASLLRGFKNGLIQKKDASLNNSISDYEGFFLALQYRKLLKEFLIPTQTEIEQFAESAEEASFNYSQLNAAYTESFHEHEERLKQFADECGAKIQSLATASQEYFEQRDEQCKALETLYEEKLKLQAPAEYWAEMEDDYRKKGTIWMWVSVGFAVLIVGALILTLALLPNLFPKNSHWFDVFKNSAIITVVTSVLVYMLRICIKLAMSSFHLSRDAKERNKLTFFYLSLIEKKAVTEKERAIVLNALFSRADTGLLKGDSAPMMSSNVTDLVKSLNDR